MFNPATKNPFECNESYFIESTFFDEFAEEGETTIAKPMGIPLPTWEEAQNDQPKKKRKTRGCRGGKKKRRAVGEIDSFVREDGRKVYLL